VKRTNYYKANNLSTLKLCKNSGLLVSQSGEKKTEKEMVFAIFFVEKC
jgi:hypothetical protein